MNICYNPYSLQNKLILITGASSGIGRATAIECSKMGATLIISGRNKVKLEETLNLLSGEDHKIKEADLSDSNDIENLIDGLPKIDGCVLSIGTTKLAPVQFSSRDKMDPVFKANFYAPIELSRLLIKKKKFREGASLVCVSSIGGNFSFDFAHCIYGSSKAALSSWMKFAAKELAPRRIRVNNICPGMTNTSMAIPGSITQEQLSDDARRYPLKRYADPKEIALAIVYFLSDASAWVTGTDFVIDGGLSLV